MPLMPCHLFRRVLLLSLLTLGLAVSAQVVKPVPVPPVPAVPPAMVAANNTFAFQLYGELAKKDGRRNLLISPLSLECALTLAANGAHGATSMQMAHTLCWGAMPQEEANAELRLLVARLQAAEMKAPWVMAHSQWITSHDRFRASYLQTNKQYFGVDMHKASFGDPDTVVPAMNAWVKKQTHGAITKVIDLDDVDAYTVLVLLDAFAFKGEWTTAFDAKLTTEQPFITGDGTPLTVPMMRRDGQFLYAEDARRQILKLPYGNGAMSLLIVLPRARQPLDALARDSFSPANWPAELASLAPRDGSVQLPRFQADYGVQLNAALNALGMIAAFDGGDSDFSGLSDEQCWIHAVQHKAALEVREDGMKAAPAPVAMIGAPDGPPPETDFTMIVDHPFLFAIQQENGTVLLLGSIVKPGVVGK